MPLSDIKPALEKISTARAKYQPFYDYYGGKHQLNFASEKFKNKFSKRLQSLRQNLCKTVVQSPASRLELVGFQSDGGNVESGAWKLWKGSKMPRIAGKVHREAFLTGDAYVIVWKDKTGKVKFYPQLAANMTVYKDGETGEITKAVKTWTENKKTFVTIYTAESIERWEAPENSEKFVLRDPEAIKNPFNRVPVFHFTYGEEMQDFGNSILADVIPLQDGLNKSLSDIFVAQEDNARRQRYMSGVQVEVDEETGKKINPFKADDDFFSVEETEAKFGEFSEVNVEQMLKVLEQCIKAIALVSAIPPSYFNLEQTGSAISGEALRKIEARFIAIIQEAQRSFGESWAEAVSFALEMQNAISKGIEIESQWTDAAPVSESEVLDNAIKKTSLGWSTEQIQRDYGLSDEQIELMNREVATREAARVEQSAKFFDSGFDRTLGGDE